MYDRDAVELAPLASGGTDAEAAMTENMLSRAVLDDLKGEGSHPGSISNRRKCELGGKLRAATGMLLREISALLRISKSSYEYHRAKHWRNRDTDIRGASGGAYGHRKLRAAPLVQDLRASEKRMRWVKREEGLEALRLQRRRCNSCDGEAERTTAPNLPLVDGARDPHDFSAEHSGRSW